jgi:uncharacterized protein
MSLEQMMQTVMEDSAYLPQTDLALTVGALSESEKCEVLGFLSERPVHTVIMMGMIRDNGVVSELNRGTFYGCRNSEGRLEGIALVGHATLIDARTSGAIRELALTAQLHESLSMFMAEQEVAETFWNAYADKGQPIRFACRELLFQLDHALEVKHRAEELRPATLADLELVAPVHAALAEAESGINPLARDPKGFIARCARRIEQGRVWVVIRDGQLIFKADIQAESAEMVYLEGVYTTAEVRGAGMGRNCLSQLCSELLTRTRSVCLLVNEENHGAQAFYRMCGFRLRSQYDTIFLAGARTELTH